MRGPIAVSVLALMAFVACGGGDRAPLGDTPPASTSTSPTAPVATAPPKGSAVGTPSDACWVGDAVCLGKDKRRACVGNASAGVAHWIEETCAAGSGCFKGVCTPSRCSDECTLGETNAGKTCTPFDIETGKTTTSDPATKMHDRARGYLARMRSESFASGGIASARYEDGSRTKLAAMDGIGDSALWTGTFLASEALRLRSTGAADARARVRALVQVMHLWLNVAGEPGMLVRWAKESAVSYPFGMSDVDCNAERVHCGISYANKKYDFVGHISRDQYQGVMLGLALAYDALGSADEDLREMVRADVVTIVEELMKERTIPIKLTFNGVPVTATVKARFIVVSPREMSNGALDLRLDLATPNDSEMYGFQEFYPNLAHLVRQLPGLAWVPDITRASSAIMLASFFRVGLRVTDGVTAYAKRRSDMLAYYTGRTGEGGNVSDWLTVAKTWADTGTCGKSYYANNIAMMPMYDLARLEDDPARSAIVESDILGAKMWPTFANTKNSFFSFIYAATKSGADPSVASSAAAQLAQYPAAPRVMKDVDLRTSAKYASRENGCTDQVAHGDAVDVGDRIVGDFMWQRDPWSLYAPGNPAQTEPGVDFLVAYFLGRNHDFIADDTPSTCLAWR